MKRCFTRTNNALILLMKPVLNFLRTSVIVSYLVRQHPLAKKPKKPKKPLPLQHLLSVTEKYVKNEKKVHIHITNRIFQILPNSMIIYIVRKCYKNKIF